MALESDYARKVGFYAFKASLLLLASPKFTFDEDILQVTGVQNNIRPQRLYGQKCVHFLLISKYILCSTKEESHTCRKQHDMSVKR